MPSFTPLIRHYVSGGDDWRSVECRVPHLRFGPGYRGWFGPRLADFRSYLEGRSTIEASSIEDICAWLADCEYLSGGNQVQHPQEFERSRKGDCADHAVWAWRKLIECGYEAEFVVGARPDSLLIGHAWLVFEDDGRSYLLESVCKMLDGMVIPLQTARGWYTPACSIDGHLVRRAYSGRCRLMEAERIQRRE